MCSCFSQVQRFVVGKSAAQDIALTLYVLGGVQDFWGQDCRVFHSSGFVFTYVPIIFPQFDREDLD